MALDTPQAHDVDRLKQNVTANPNYVRVGLPDSPEKDSDGLTIAQIGMIHEYGAPAAGIPERPFLHSAIAEGKEEIARLSEIELRKIQNGQTTKGDALQQLGNLGVRLVQEKIRQGEFAPLKPRR